jgi:hypothetical protein
MKLSMRAGFAALFLAASLNAACKKADNGTPAADSSTTMAPAPAAALAVVSVDLGRSLNADKRVVAAIDDFGTRDTIFASVATTGSGTGTLAAHWTFEDGQTVEHSEQAVSATGPAVTEFHIAKPSAWPAGKYKVVITLDGQEVGSKEFEVK